MALPTSDMTTPPRRRESQPGIRGYEHAPQPEYGYLPQVGSLTSDQVEITLRTYRQYAAAFSRVEYNQDEISKYMTDVMPFIARHVIALPPNAVLSVGACGSFKDMLSMAVMNKGIVVKGFDVTPELLEEGAKHLDAPTLLTLMSLMQDASERTGSYVNGWVQEINQGMDKLRQIFGVDTDMQKLWLIFGETVLGQVLPRIQYQVGRLQDQVEAPGTVDMAFVSAAFQHLTDEDADIAFGRMINSLKPGAVAFYNERVDTHRSPDLEGNVFRDTLLGGERHYRTLKIHEFGPRLDRWEQLFNCSIEELVFSAPVRKQKPPFKWFKATRLS